MNLGIGGSASVPSGEGGSDDSVEMTQNGQRRKPLVLQREQGRKSSYTPPIMPIHTRTRENSVDNIKDRDGDVIVIRRDSLGVPGSGGAVIFNTTSPMTIPTRAGLSKGAESPVSSPSSPRRSQTPRPSMSPRNGSPPKPSAITPRSGGSGGASPNKITVVQPQPTSASPAKGKQSKSEKSMLVVSDGPRISPFRSNSARDTKLQAAGKTSHSSGDVPTKLDKITKGGKPKAMSDIRDKERSKEEKEREKMREKEEKAKEKEERERKEKEEKAKEKEERERKEKERREKKEMKLKKKEEREKERDSKDKEDKLGRSPARMMFRRKSLGRSTQNLLKSKSGDSLHPHKGPDELDRVSNRLGLINSSELETQGAAREGGADKYVLPDEEVEKQLNNLNSTSDIISLQILPFEETLNPPGKGPLSKQMISGPGPHEAPDFILWPKGSGRGKYRVYGQTMSTYPGIPGVPGIRQGDPVCDCFSVRCYDNGLIFCVCDGCGWGRAACEAAQIVQSTFMKRLHDSATHPEKKSIFDLANLLLEVLADAHNNILDGKDKSECGSTTVVAGFLLDLESDGEKIDEKGLLMISIGDCKVYRFDSRKGVVSDLTYGSRLNLLNPSDCGGRVGPSGHGAPHPDLRNLKLSFVPCCQGDLLWVVSDGVHDNIDPQWMGLLPKDLGMKEVAGLDSWNDDALAKDQELLGRVKNDFSMRLLKRMLFNNTRALEMMKKLAADNPDADSDGEDDLTSDSDSDGELAGSCGASDLLKRYFGADDDDLLFESGEKDRKPKPNRPVVQKGDDSDTNSQGGSAGKSAGQDLLLRVGEEEEQGEATSKGDNEADDEAVSPRTVTLALIRHAIRVTSTTRTFMEANPSKRQPDDLLNYPGKMDHTTCVTFRV